MNNEFRYYYVTWANLEEPEAGSHAGVQVLAMKYEFDLGYAHEWIHEEYGTKCMITNWREISKAQYDSFSVYCQKINDDSESPKAQLLKLVKDTELPVNQD